MLKPPRLPSARTSTLIYLAFGVLWILLGDRTAEALISDPARLTWVQTIKGWVYIAITAAGLYLLLKRFEKALAELRSSETRLRAILDTSYQFTALLEPDGRLSAASPSESGLMALHPGDRVGKPIWALSWWSDDAQKTLLRDAVARAGAGEIVRYRARIQGPEGPEAVDFSIKPVFDDAGTVTRLVAEGNVVTELERAQALALDRIAELDQIFDALPVALVYVDPDRRIMRVNPAFERIFGYPAETVIGRQTRFAYAREEDFDALGNQRFNPKAGASAQPIVVDYRAADGRRFPGETVGMVVRDARGEVIGYAGLITDISDRLRAEAALRDSETRYRALFEQAPHSLLVIEAGTGRFDDFNQHAHQALGYTREEFAGLRLKDIEANESPMEVERHIIAVIRSGHDVFTTRQRAKSGEIRDVRVSAQSIRLQGDHYIAAIFEDITEQAREERARLKLIEEQRMLLDCLPSFVFFKDNRNRILRITQSVADATGLPREQIEGRPSEEIYGDMASRYFEDDLAVIRSGQPKRGIVEPLPAADGGTRWLLTDKFPHRDANGEIEGIVVVSTDITELKRSELAIRESEKRYRTLFEHIPQGVIVHDATGKIVDANPAAERILGRSRDEILGLESGSRTWQGVREDGSDLPADAHPAQLALQERQAQAPVVMGVFNPQRQAQVWIEAAAVPLIEPGASEPYGAFASFSDITEQRALQQALILTQRLEAVGQLASGIAHDFNNILGSVLGFAALTRARNAGADEKIADYSDQIETAALRARDLIRQLLIYSRGELGKQAEVAPVNPAITETLSLMRPTLPAAIDVGLELPEPAPLVKVPAGQLQQMVMNLCINARDAMPHGGALTVSVRRRHFAGKRCSACGKSVSGSYVEVQVRDAGQGIPSAQLDQVCEPFFTTKEIGKGSGMGLSVVAGLLLPLGGHLLIDSEVGRGTAVSLLLPPAEAEAPSGEPETAHAAAPRLPNPRLLVVDDEPSLLEYYREALSGAGAEVTVAANGQEALEAFTAAPEGFDLVLTDLGLPGMDGQQLVAKIREIDRDIPIILCTGNDERLTTELREGLGIAEVLIKPVLLPELAEAIERALAPRRHPDRTS